MKAEGEGDQLAGLEADKAITRTAGPLRRPTSCENAKVRGVDSGNMFLPTFINQDMWELLSGMSSENALNALCVYLRLSRKTRSELFIPH